MSEIAEPIPGDNPAGVDLRRDPDPNNLFRKLKDEADAARRTEKVAIEAGESPSAAIGNWVKVQEYALDILTTKSKDAEVAAFLIEALVRLDGFAGLQQGFAILREMCETFWEPMWPQPDEDEGMFARFVRLDGLNGKVLIDPLNRLNITEGQTQGPFAFWQYRQAAELKNYSDRERQVRIERGAVTQEQFDRAVRETSATFFRQLVTDLQGATDEFKKLFELIDAKCGSQGPGSSAIREAFENFEMVIKDVTRAVDLSAPAPAAAAAGTSVVTAGGVAVQTITVPVGEIGTRDDAFKALDKVADYFERTEPQSLLPSLIRKVVKWGKLSPVEFYMELIEDRTVRETIFKQVGIKPPENESSY